MSAEYTGSAMSLDDMCSLGLREVVRMLLHPDAIGAFKELGAA